VAVVLLVEDNVELGGQVVGHLKGAGYDVVWWRTGRDVCAETLEGTALVVLDLELPKVPGMEMLQQLRAFSDVPVLVLSAWQDHSDKVRALKLGADDYVTKPFWPEELVERVHARLRRISDTSKTTWVVGAVALDEANRQANRGSEVLKLTRVEFDLLLALAKNVDKAVSRAWLLANVLDPEREATERTLDVHIMRLRKKLGGPATIETVWGIGYRVRGDLA
jgi:DNA-binding response OmpR family regulator